jgi:hypothetical protein
LHRLNAPAKVAGSARTVAVASPDRREDAPLMLAQARVEVVEDEHRRLARV